MIGDKVRVNLDVPHSNVASRMNYEGEIIFENDYFKTIKAEKYCVTVHRSDREWNLIKVVQ